MDPKPWPPDERQDIYLEMRTAPSIDDLETVGKSA